MATTTENITRAIHRTAHANGVDMGQLRKKLDKGVRTARKSANRGISATDAYVHKHPWAAVGIAAGAMALAGMAIAAMIRKPRSTRSAISDGVEEFLRAASSRVKGIGR